MSQGVKENPFPFRGLTAQEVSGSRAVHGQNTIEDNHSGFFWYNLKEIVREPMFLLLLATSIIYFILREFSEGFFLLGAIVLISAISFYQNARSKKALSALKEYTQSLSTVIRDKQLQKIKSEEIVVDDVVVANEGELITADGVLLQQNDFLVNESILTGESLSIAKTIEDPDKNLVYKGTAVVSGQGVYRVTQIGKATKLGRINTSLSEIEKIRSPLQQQISRFVKQMAIGGFLIFLVIWGISFYNSRDVFDSLLKGLTIAMSVLPEEIPVAFATFMALGAYRLMKLGIIVKHTQTIETLGSATVICTDKTGTITQNKMELFKVYDHKTGRTAEKDHWKESEFQNIIRIAMWASEIVPFDPMERSIHKAYKTFSTEDERPKFSMVHEYPLGGKPPMMTHIFENAEGKRIIAVKGAPEAVINHSGLSNAEKEKIMTEISRMASKGFRVLGVGEAFFDGKDFPEKQEEFKFEFLGLVGFYDPPKENINETLQHLYNAGIRIKLITGDNPATTHTIARLVNLQGSNDAVTGEELMNLNQEEFDRKVSQASVFSRIFPEIKVKIVNSLKRQHEIVGMTGDGVNDAPALKAAHIGIAMGRRGSDLAKESSSLILSDDDFGKMVDGVAMGRKIYYNLKKAIQYIISIHIPIILTVALPVILGWVYPVIFSPVHVIFLELIMGPTCSIIYENEPLEKNSMLKPPRAMDQTFLRWKELSVSVFQGLMITAVCLGIYQYSVLHMYSEDLTRTMVFSTLIVANIFLTLVNRSFYFSIWTTFKYKNSLIWVIISVSFVILLFMVYNPGLGSFFKLEPMATNQLLIVLVAGFASVIWFEIYKAIIRRRKPLKLFSSEILETGKGIIR
ncbi:cation-translocating P-type ATPase [Antarcticibacterium arcticum]|uniref:Cation-translocating P-type ATPase n=1 Tax=Antarcticibacterium arcticum TaxID=2585771 RepID=A0A5B8YIY8_9FLAO|nr:cation-translocating P-type ATPase [Antarcticibacterium arcticum]QED36583.1 cation-translocating P-type ATPase [Antarcticibacterium arcticum]